jgi:hypothetical protein
MRGECWYCSLCVYFGIGATALIDFAMFLAGRAKSFEDTLAFSLWTAVILTLVPFGLLSFAEFVTWLFRKLSRVPK